MNARDEAFDRLTGADPADGTPTREGVLRAKVDAMRDGTDEAAGTAQEPAPGSSGVAPGTPTDELAPRRRRRRPLLVAAAVAGAVVVAGGGFAVGTATAGEQVVASDSRPPITLGGGQGGRGGAEAAAEGAVAGDASTESMAATDDMAYPSWFDGRATFSQQGLGTAGGTATAYAYDPTEVATEQGAARLADELGVEGEPRWDWGSWSVGPQDGTGPSLWLSADGTAYFSYNDPAADPWQCEELSAEELAEQEIDPAVTGDQQCAEPTGSVSVKKAVGELSTLMERLGVDPDGYEFEPSTDSEPGSRWVTAYEVVDGQRTGATWSATVSKDGVAWLDGFLAPTVELGEYPVISPAEAVERLADPRFGQNLWPVTFGPAMETRMMDEPENSGPTPLPAPPSSGEALPWPITDVTITSARLGLAQEHRTDAATLLLPAYELSDAEGNVWSVIAVAEEALDLSAG